MTRGQKMLKRLVAGIAIIMVVAAYTTACQSPAKIPVPVLTAPASGAEHVSSQPLFEWQPVADAVSYEFSLAEDADFESAVYSVTVAASPHSAITSLKHGARYSWRVRAVSAAGQSEWAVAAFTVGQASEPAPAAVNHSLSFTLEGEEDYVFQVYLGSTETLDLQWRVEDGETKVWFHIVTPSGLALGFYDDGSYAAGTLEDDATRGMTVASTRFSPLDYDWGEGYYTMAARKYTDMTVTVTVEYRIEP